MKEQFCTYEIALKLKELGFDECCLAVYFKNKFQLIKGFNINNVDLHVANKMDAILAPLWQQVIDWFRNLHGVIIEVYIPRYIPYEYNFAIYYPDELTKNHLNEKYFNEIIYDYNVAREIAILKAIELCKKKQ